VNALLAEPTPENPSKPTVFRRFYLKYKTFLAVATLIAMLVVVYCILSLLVSESIGIPRQMQPTVSLSQKEVYSNLCGFELRGIDNNVLFTYDDFGYVVIDNIDSVGSYFDYVTVFLSRLSDPGTSVLLRTHESGDVFGYGGSEQYRVHFTRFSIYDGQNTIPIPVGDWTALELRLGNRQHMSMTVDEVTLSRFPVLPDWFIPVYVVLVLIISAVWFFIVFRGLGRWFLAHPYVLLVILIFFQSLLMAYYIGQRISPFVDEMHTITRGVAFMTGEEPQRRFDNRPDFTNTWHTPDYFWNAITVQQSERFDFVGLYRFIRISGHSNPLDFTTYLLAASFFPETYSLWIGGSINIIWLALVSVFMYKASLLLIKDSLIALLPVAIWGFTGAAMSLAVFIRFYTPSTFFFTLTTYLALLLLTKTTRAGLKYCLALGAIFLFGWFTNLQFVLFFGISAAMLLFWLLRSREYIQIRNCIITLVISVIAHTLFYGGYFIDLLRGGGLRTVAGVAEHREEVMGVQGSDVHMERIDGFLSFLNNDFFGGNIRPLLYLFIAVVVIAIVIQLSRFASAHKNESSYSFTLKIPSLVILRKQLLNKRNMPAQQNTFIVFFLIILITVFFVVVARYALHLVTYTANRYMLPIYPTLAITLVFLFYLVLNRIKQINTTIILLVVSVFLIFSNSLDRSVLFLHPERPDTVAILSAEESRDTLVVVPEVEGMGFRGLYWLTNQLYVFPLFDRTFIADAIPNDFDSEDFNNAINSISYGEGVFVLIANNINTDIFFEHMQSLLDFRDTELLYRKDFMYGRGYDMHRIVW